MLIGAPRREAIPSRVNGMILDATGTEFRSGRLILPEEWRLDKNRPLQWWMPQGDQTIYKAVVRNMRGEMLWQRPFGNDLVKALQFQFDFMNGERLDCPSFDMPVFCEVANVTLFLSVGNHVWRCPDGITPVNRLPNVFPPGDPNFDPELWEATNGSFTATNTTAADWFTGNKAPSGVTSVDYLVVAGGGGGSAGGGGAGGYKTATALSVTPGTAYTVTVGAGGGGQNGTSVGGNGGDSVFSSITSTGGGGAGADVASTTGSNGGSGGGGGSGIIAGTAGSTTGGGQGNNGGNGGSDGEAFYSAGGGGGSSAVGSAGSNGTAGAGGNGTSSSITGSPVTRAGGGGGKGPTADGAAGTGGATAGNYGGSASNATANTGSGAGGGNVGGNGGSGIIGLQYTATSGSILRGNNSFTHMIVR